MSFRTILLTLLTVALVGCGAPKPPLPSGERMPINPDTASYFEAQQSRVQTNIRFASETDDIQTP